MIERTWTRSDERLDTLIARCLHDTSAVRAIEREGLWEHVATRACKNRLGGALIHALERHETDVPESASTQLHLYREHIAAKNTYQMSRVTPLLKKLVDANIPFMVLKGAVLNATLYDEPGLRGMTDIDVLIQPEDVERTDRVLTEVGCQRGPDLVREDFYPRFYYEREYFTPSCPEVKIDLHVRPFRPLRYAQTVPDDALWNDPQYVAINGVDIAVPNPVNMLIHLAVHAACHGLAHIRWLYDIERWWDKFRPHIDLSELSDKCQKWGLSLPVERALRKVAATFPESQDTFSEAIRAVTRPVRFLDRWLLEQAPHDVDRPATALLTNLITTPGLSFKLSYCQAILIPDKNHLAQLYPHRHPGWQLIAHAIRATRTLSRPFTTETA